MTEICQNCGGVIGKLETPMIWKENVVCGICYKKLNQSGIEFVHYFCLYFRRDRNSRCVDSVCWNTLYPCGNLGNYFRHHWFGERQNKRTQHRFTDWCEHSVRGGHRDFYRYDIRGSSRNSGEHAHTNYFEFLGSFNLESASCGDPVHTNWHTVAGWRRTGYGYGSNTRNGSAYRH